VFDISVKAKIDIDSIIDYSIHNFGVDAMYSYHASLEKCFDDLANNPDLGLRSDFIRKNYLRFYHRSHVIFYQTIKNGILIIRVLHQCMDI